jgi:hypothetical protein
MTNGILMIGSCKNESTQNLNQFPDNIQIEINNYLKKKLGKNILKN